MTYRMNSAHEQDPLRLPFKFQLSLLYPWLLTAYAQSELPSEFAKSFCSQIFGMIIFLAWKYEGNWAVIFQPVVALCKILDVVNRIRKEKVSGGIR